MPTLHLICRLGDADLGKLISEHVPRAGDLLDYHPPEWTGFKGQATWLVDAVRWQVAMPGSQWVLERIRSGQITDPSGTGHVTDDLDLFVWPVQGPHWPETPRWARPFVGDEDDA